MARISAVSRIFRHKLKKYFLTGLLVVVTMSSR